MPDKEQFANLDFPVDGVDLSSAYGQQRQGTTPTGKNVVVYEPLTSRGRGGSRAGLLKYIPGQIPGGPHKIQMLNVVVDPSGQGLLDNFDPGTDAVDDPSNLGRSRGRRVRVGVRRFRNRRRGSGSGRQPSKSSKKTPVIQWATPGDISQGTPLDNSILNAVAVDPVTLVPVSGTYVYTPPSGTVLSVGDHQTLRVKFTPDDVAKQFYVSASGSVQINVKSTDIVFVQAKDNFAFGYSASAQMGADVTKGNLILVFASKTIHYDSFLHPPPPDRILAVTDSQGNTYTQAGIDFFGIVQAIPDPTPPPPADRILFGMSCWWAIAQSSGPCTATVTDSPVNSPPYGTGELDIGFLEYKGLSTTPFDGYSTRSGSLAPSGATTGGVVVSQSNELLVGAFWTALLLLHLPPDDNAAVRINRNSSNMYVFDRISPGAGLPVISDGTTPVGAGFGAYIAFGVSFQGT